MDRRQNNGSVKAVSPRHCPATSALRNCCFNCRAGQSHKDYVRCIAVEEQLEAKEVQRLKPTQTARRKTDCSANKEPNNCSVTAVTNTDFGKELARGPTITILATAPLSASPSNEKKKRPSLHLAVCLINVRFAGTGRLSKLHMQSPRLIALESIERQMSI